MKLEKLLESFEKVGLKIKPDKCELLPERMTLLGHVISTPGIEGDETKVEVIKSWPIPTKLTELRSFLAHFGYYQRFIASYADITGPLRKLDKQSARFIWDEECLFKKLIGINDFSFQFRKIITRYRRIGYNLNVMRQSACLVFNQIMVDNYAAFFNCTPMGRTSDSMMAPT